MELHGPPMTDLRGLVLSVFDQERSGTVIALPLTGSLDPDGFYIIGNVTGAGEGPFRDRQLFTTFLNLTLSFTSPPLSLSPSCVDLTFPEGSAVPARGAVVLCYDLFSVCRAGTALTNSSLRDVLVFSENQQLLSSLSTSRGRQVIPAAR